MKPKVKVDIFSDVVCPWCYIGKRRFEAAIKNLNIEYDFEIQYLPFELNPAMPKTGADQEQYLSAKFGSIEKYRQILTHVTKVAAAEGLNFNFDKQKISPNTKSAHRLIWLASKNGVQLQLVEMLFKAYFEEGVDLTNSENLISIAEKAGINRKVSEAFLKSNEGEVEVDTLLSAAKRIGVSGVPFYIFNNQYAVSGAQASEVFAEVIKESISTASATGESCDVDGNNC